MAGVPSLSLDSPCIAADIESLLGRLPGLRALHGQRLLLSGGTGFFGRWLLATFDALHAAGVQPRVTLVSRDPERFLRQEPRYRQAPWLDWCAGDMRTVDLGGRPFDLLLHAGTDTSAEAHRDGLAIYDGILQGTRNLLDAAVAGGVRRVLLVGSGAQYGRQPADSARILEAATHACASESADSAYGEAKRAAETLGALYARREGFAVVHARCFAFAGPGLPLDGHFAIGNFIRDALWHDAIRLQSRGEALRSYLYGADLAGWLLTLLMQGRAGEAYNVGSDAALSVVDLAQRVAALLAPDKPLRVADQGDAGPRSRYIPDIDKARGLGLDVWTPLDQAILRTAQWWRDA
ncbi:NAD(P)-dependent oxidoreductase [Pseudomonas sp. RIT-PI-AD]|uniref:NAD-dependent epimerase/dehydratase family protein n=1 Tax=Pseudomonas sp. RIT-PI-AD TaxID=3035294 RepID=UPI0021DB7C9A|nr:NAD(P)-dependent oxidoreductase [Pseudomonas sp. RIT-PI-AD]